MPNATKGVDDSKRSDTYEEGGIGGRHLSGVRNTHESRDNSSSCCSGTPGMRNAPRPSAKRETAGIDRDLKTASPKKANGGSIWAHRTGPVTIFMWVGRKRRISANLERPGRRKVSTKKTEEQYERLGVSPTIIRWPSRRKGRKIHDLAWRRGERGQIKVRT